MSKTAERTHPELWETVKAELKESSKGGKAGEWSARKAQLAVQEYKKRGGGYRGKAGKDTTLKPWGEPEWQPQAGRAGAESGRAGAEAGERYQAREAAEPDYETPRAGGKERGEAVKEPKPLPRRARSKAVSVKSARYRPEPKPVPVAAPTKADLLRQAKMLEIDGRSRMTKDELARAVRYAKH